MSFLVVGDHHRNVEFLETLPRQRYAYISAVTVSAQGNGVRDVPDLVCLMIQAIASVVHLLADMMTSPSFSLDSSSMTTIGSPRANAASASSIVSKEKSVRCGGLVAGTGRHAGSEPLSFDGDGTGIIVCDLLALVDLYISDPECDETVSLTHHTHIISGLAEFMAGCFRDSKVFP